MTEFAGGVYTYFMPSKIPPISFRPGAERAAKIAEWGRVRGLDQSKAIAELIDAGLGVYTHAPQPSAKIGKMKAKAEVGGPTIIRPKPGALLDKKAKRWRV